MILRDGKDFIEAFVFFMLLSFSIALSEKYSESSDDEPNEDSQLFPDTWIDPGNMLETDLTSVSSSYQKGDEQTLKESGHDRGISTKIDARVDSVKVKIHDNIETTSQQHFELPYFKQLTRIILELFPTPGKRYTTVELKDHDLKMLKEFKEHDTQGEQISDVFDVIVRIFEHTQIDGRLENSFLDRILLLFEYNKEIFALGFIICVILFVLLIFEIRTSLPWYQQCWYLFGLLFLISIPWEWFRLYRKEYAVKQAELIKKMPEVCIPKNMTVTGRLSLWMAGLLSWSDDRCIKYQEAILVDPVWEVSPSLALSTTATRLVFKPLEYIAESFGKSLRAFLAPIPALWQPAMIVLLTVTLLFCILLLTKSRIKFGFFEIGPSAVQARRLEAADIDVLRNCIREEVRDMCRKAAPIRRGNLEEIPDIGATDPEERTDGQIVSRIRESPVDDIRKRS